MGNQNNFCNNLIFFEYFSIFSIYSDNFFCKNQQILNLESTQVNLYIPNHPVCTQFID